MPDMNSAPNDDENWEDATSDVESTLSICLEPSYNDRIELALEAWKQGQHTAPKISTRYVAKVYRIAKSTLIDRINKAKSKKEACELMQRISPREEEALRDWIIQLAAWGWLV